MNPSLRLLVTLQEVYSGKDTQYVKPLDLEELADLEPMRLTDIPVMTLDDEIMLNSTTHDRKLTLRKDAVDAIARDIAEQFMKVLETRDTFNGYPLNKGGTTHSDQTTTQIFKERLERIAAIAHSGGALGYSDAETALRKIRKLTS